MNIRVVVVVKDVGTTTAVAAYVTEVRFAQVNIVVKIM